MRVVKAERDVDKMAYILGPVYALFVESNNFSLSKSGELPFAEL